MIASVHVADVGVRRALALLRKAPKPTATPGLRSAKIGLAAPLSASVLPRPGLRRVGLVAMWDDDDALDRFLAEHPTAAALAGGWQVRLAPLRAFGTWPGLPSDVAKGRAAEHDGPAVVTTLGRMRLTQALRFLRASAKASGDVVGAPGLLWATGLASPPFVSTISLWKSSDALSAYAYGDADGGHPSAIAADRSKPFHHESAFIRFRPYGAHGALDGKNPLRETLLANS